MEDKEIYVVVLGVGSYDDYRDNVHVAFEKESDADRFVRRANDHLAKSDGLILALYRCLGEWDDKNPMPDHPDLSSYDYENLAIDLAIKAFNEQFDAWQAAKDAEIDRLEKFFGIYELRSLAEVSKEHEFKVARYYWQKTKLKEYDY